MSSVLALQVRFTWEGDTAVAARFWGCVGGAGVGDRAVARLRAGIGERLSRHRHELPVVARRMERQLEDAEGVAVPDLAVREMVVNDV